jgi:hypothetical protein
MIDVGGEIQRFYKLLYVIKLSLFHKKISCTFFKRNLVKRWRFYNKIKRISKEKLKVLQDNMNNVYLNMADEFMGETGNSMKNNVLDNLMNMDMEKPTSMHFSEISSMRSLGIQKKSKSSMNLSEKIMEEKTSDEV